MLTSSICFVVSPRCNDLHQLFRRGDRRGEDFEVNVPCVLVKLFPKLTGPQFWSMTRREAYERFTRAVSKCVTECMHRASRQLIDDLRPLATPEELAEFERWLKSDDQRSLEGVERFIQSFRESQPGETRAERLKRESEFRKDYFKWARGFVRKPAAGGRPEKLTTDQKATIVSRVREFLAEGMTRQEAFEAAGKPFDASVSTVRRVWTAYVGSRKPKPSRTKGSSRKNRQ